MSYAPCSFPVGDSIAANRIVRVNSSGNVALCSATTDIIAGVTLDNVPSSSQAVPVGISGIHRVYMNDTGAAGILVSSDASGRGVPFAEATAGAYVVGILLETVSATGTLAEVLVRPTRLNDVP